MAIGEPPASWTLRASVVLRSYTVETLTGEIVVYKLRNGVFAGVAKTFNFSLSAYVETIPIYLDIPVSTDVDPSGAYALLCIVRVDLPGQPGTVVLNQQSETLVQF